MALLRQLCGKLARVLRPDAIVRFGLTPREAEVLIWVAQGKSNPEVGLILGISSYTVRTHLERIFAKLGAPSLAQAPSTSLPPSSTPAW